MLEVIIMDISRHLRMSWPRDALTMQEWLTLRSRSWKRLWKDIVHGQQLKKYGSLLLRMCDLYNFQVQQLSRKFAHLFTSSTVADLPLPPPAATSELN